MDEGARAALKAVEEESRAEVEDALVKVETVAAAGLSRTEEMQANVDEIMCVWGNISRAGLFVLAGCWSGVTQKVPECSTRYLRTGNVQGVAIKLERDENIAKSRKTTWQALTKYMLDRRGGFFIPGACVLLPAVHSALLEPRFGDLYL